MTQTRLILIVTLFMVLLGNYAFFHNLLQVYPLQRSTVGFLLSLIVVIFSLTALVLTLLSSRWIIKPLLIFVLIASSLSAYFMTTYHVVIDEGMLRNAFQTDLKETTDLFSIKLLLYLLFLGLLPAYVVYKTPILSGTFKQALFAKLKLIALLLLIIVGAMMLYSKHYASFLREHRPLRYSVNPLYWIYSIGKYGFDTLDKHETRLKTIGLDARIAAHHPHKLVVMVVGEAVRADHLSLNDYKRETTPLLAKEPHVINFPRVYSCGTSTAHSVPCMFSIYDREEYSDAKAMSTENVLDVLKHTGKVAMLWRDNNSDSKGVALRIPYEWYKSPQLNHVCSDGECRDIGMLEGLDAFIQKHKNKDILIILHQMGNHGPAYYKRYPKSFERYTPVCKTNQLEACSKEEIANAYDNSLLYTDHFLDQTIQWLKHYDQTHQTALLYMADHGESLGEGGLYLHGMPYFMAPDAQKHVAALIWLGDHPKNKPLIETLQKKAKRKYSQDNLFDTLLGIFDVNTSVYHPSKDILHAP